ncbi:hypothetical protein FRC09_003401 [Ceratobasidium sp. 395]|nr:hypothetical protein FRC09_003401 [Ceratobasidium sp. 395]
MLVLQECSICYFDFSSERSPHCIPCGHVFCRECLVTALDHSERCPICRDPCLPEEIRKVVCSEDAPSTPPQESEDEKQMWKAIVDATEPGKEYEQRKAAFKNDLEPTLYGENNLNPNLFAAANLMKMLVRAERRNRQLETKLNAAKAAEQELREQVQTFEAESNRRCDFI